MPILHVRNVPGKLYERLRRRAETQRRSLSAEVITLLAWAIDDVERSPREALASIRSRRFFRPAAVGAPDTISILRQDRER